MGRYRVASFVGNHCQENKTETVVTVRRFVARQSRRNLQSRQNLTTVQGQDSGPQQDDRDAAVMQDRHLVDRCLASEAKAWDVLYERYNNGLLFSIRLMLGPGDWDPNLVDEIAARVWYSLVQNEGRLLGRFDTERGCRLSTFLARVAKSEASEFFRGERRRKKRERIASRPESDENQFTPRQFETQIEEFAQSLTPREREFVADFLLECRESTEFTMTNRWQLSSRVRQKLREFVALRAD